uniref:Uncharacterized protein n=1 Tax=Rhizophora mucronata TaxID=61149 RepID=A0A2P2MEX7_RHIMU
MVFGLPYFSLSCPCDSSDMFGRILGNFLKFNWMNFIEIKF